MAKVLYLQMHDSAHLPTIGNIPATLPAPNKTFENLAMEHLEAASVVEVRFRHQNRDVQFRIPLTAIKVFQIEPAEKT